MTQYLIIPSGGSGQRFIDNGYKTYKPFLKVTKKYRIIDNIINNFSIKDTHLIIVGNKKNFQKTRLNFNIKKISFIQIKNHKHGPVYSLFLAKKKN